MLALSGADANKVVESFLKRPDLVNNLKSICHHLDIKHSVTLGSGSHIA
jgi:hypothetical protein